MKFQMYLLFLLIPTVLFSQRHPNSQLDSVWRAGITYISEEKFDLATREFIKIEKSYPDLPVSRIYFAAIEMVKANDLGRSYPKDMIEAHLNVAEDKAKKLLAKNRGDIWNNYFYALTKAYRAYFYALQEDWLSAFTNGLESINYFQKCLDMDQQFYESHIAIHSYNYWKTRKTEFLSWLPFVSGDTGPSVASLERYVHQVHYNQLLAMTSLQWIYIDRGEYRKAVALGEKVIEKYPGNRYFRWGIARAYEGYNRDMAVKVYLEVLASYNRQGIKSNINEITLKHKIAMNLNALGKKAEAKRYCEEILAVKNLNSYERDVLSDRLKRVQELYREL